jgi:RNA polymerase sigma-70 factor (ECF subfamily)
MGVRNREIEWETREQSSAKLEEAERTVERLVRRAMRGDDGALYTLCEKIARRVLFLASHIMREPSDAEDVSQEVLIRVCENIGKLRAPEAFWSWLSKIVANESQTHIRKNANHSNVVNMDDYIGSLAEEDEATLPQEYAENEEIRRLVLALIDSLPPRQREAVMLHYYGGMGVNEIAEQMGVDHSNASRYLVLAREKLKREIEKHPSSAVRMYSGVGISLASLMGDVLKWESLRFQPLAGGWEQQALANCRKLISLRPPVVTTASIVSKAVFWPVIGLVSAGVVTGGVYVGVQHYGVPPLMQQAAPVARAMGQIHFSGGEELGDKLLYRNPTGATAKIDSENGEVTAIEWYITPGETNDKLYSGEGSDAAEALAQLQETGSGKYVLNMLFEDKTGAVYRLYESFWVGMP